jgi:hypothetical protein
MDEERIRGLEDAVINLSRILELKSGYYANERMNPEITTKGAEIHRWAQSVEDRRAGT